jgi:LysM repeat protein
MSVAPELPPAPVTRGPVRRRLRAVPVLVDRTPAGVVAVVEAPPAAPPRPARPGGYATMPAPREPGLSALTEEPEAEAARRPAPEVWPATEPRAFRRSAVGEPRAFRRSVVEGVPQTYRRSVVEGVPGAFPRSAVEPVPGSVRRSAVDVDGPSAVAATAGVVRRPVGARVVRPAGSGVRLTRRGRVVTVLAVLVLAGFALVGVAGRVGALHGSPVPASAPTQVVVEPGETLWSIAERVAPKRDPRPVVDQIRRLNDLPTTDVHPGQTLRLHTP